MSAFIVGKAHIDLLVTAGLWRRQYGPMRWDANPRPVNPETWGDLDGVFHDVTRDNASDVGRMLWAENLKSIHFRYPDTLETPERYPGPNEFRGQTSVDAYQFEKIPGEIDPVVVASAVFCYDYQSCEHPGYRSSEASRYLDALKDHLLHELPGYEAAPYEFSDRTYFTTRSA